MAQGSFIQNVYYHFILKDPTLAMSFDPDFFSSKTLQIAFKLAKDYVIKYHQAPSSQQMKELTRINNLNEQLGDDMIDSLYGQQQMLGNYDPEWLYDEVTAWAMIENMKKSIVEAASYLKLNQDVIGEGKVRDMVEHIKAMFNQSCVIDFTDGTDGGSDFWNAESHVQKKLKRRPSGYDFIDYCLNGGWFDGSLIVFVGAPKIGKSLWLQNICAQSVKMGENCAYVTLELPEEMVVARIGSNMFNIPSLSYNAESEDVNVFADKIKSFRSSCFVSPGELLVKEFPTSTLSVIELEAFLLREEEKRSTKDVKFKFKNIFVDYINIMKNYRNPNTENTYMKIKQIAEDLRAMAIKNAWCIISATQTNRTQFETNDITTSQVSESSALGATVDAMFGIIADPLMMAQGNYYLKCMYDRVSPQANKKKLYKCDFNYLRITEDTSEPILDAVDMYGNVQGGDRFIKGNPKKGGFAKQEFAPGNPMEQIKPEEAPVPSNISIPQVQSTNVVDCESSSEQPVIGGINPPQFYMPDITKMTMVPPTGYGVF